MGTIKGGAKVMQAIRLPGENLAACKAQWDRLSEAEQRQLVEYAKTEGIASD